jgi:hypothetical protein
MDETTREKTRGSSGLHADETSLTLYNWTMKMAGGGHFVLIDSADHHAGLFSCGCGTWMDVSHVGTIIVAATVSHQYSYS